MQGTGFIGLILPVISFLWTGILLWRFYTVERGSAVFLWICELALSGALLLWTLDQLLLRHTTRLSLIQAGLIGAIIAVGAGSRWIVRYMA